jgi:hypothetical protein
MTTTELRLPPPADSSRRDAALWWAARRFPVVPLHHITVTGCSCPEQSCTNAGKHPRITGWRTAASTDELAIGTWWEQYPNANVGVVTDGHVVVDVDPRNGGEETYTRLADDHEFPGTLTQRTGEYDGQRGRHLIYRQNGTPVRNGELGQGVDIKGDGGLLVVASSGHLSGVNYELVDSDAEIAEVPEWIVEKLGPGRAAGSAGAGAAANGSQTLDELLAHPPGAGERDTWVTRVCGHYARTHRDDEAAYETSAREAYDSLPDADGYTPAKFSKTARSIWDAEHRKPGPAPVPGVWRDGRPTIDVTGRESADIANESWGLLVKLNKPPSVYRSGGFPARVESDDDGRPRIGRMGPDRVRHKMAYVAAYVKQTKNDGWQAVGPPPDVITMMLARADLPLPVLTRIVSAPVFGPSGELQLDPGYHADSRTLYVPADGFEIPPVPDAPSEIDVAQAVDAFDDQVCDFPFKADADRAHAAALFLLPFVRDLISGSTPLHLFDKPEPGTGAGLLVETLLAPALGTPPASMGECGSDDEWRKRITSKLIAGSSIISLDNLEGRLSSPVLAAALTQPVWEDRILGASQIGSWPMRCVWAATANNLSLSRDIARRTVRVRLDAGMERPWLRQRQEFQHELPSYAYEQRPDTVWAALVLVQAWLAAGRPAWSGRTLGGYEDWSKVVGGILAHAGIEGFLSNLDEMYDEADSESETLVTFVELWWKAHGSDPATTSQLVRVADSGEGPLDLGSGNRPVRLGAYLNRNKDRLLTLDSGEQVRIERAAKRSVSRWQLAVPGRLSL